MPKPIDQEFVDNLEAKKFKATIKDRSLNTDRIVQKLDSLKPLEEVRVSNFPEQPKEFILKLDNINAITLKGDKGDSPTEEELLNLIKPLIPEVKDGEDYILTQEDKKEIASKIKVPVVEKVVEKTEVIKEQPIVTNEIKEVAKYETAEQIKEKLQTIKEAWIEITSIAGFEEYMRVFGGNFLEQAKAFVPRSLDSLYDVAVRGTIQNGQSLVYNAATQKWIPGSASVGGMSPLTIIGTVDGSNQTFTVASKPSVVYVDGIAMQETDSNGATQWSYSGTTLTLSTPPPLNAIFGYQ